MFESGRLAAGVCAVLMLGCGSSDDSPGTQKKGPTLDGMIHNFVVDECNTLVAGVEVCVVGQPDIPCATTDDQGIADLAVPKDQEMVISYAKQDFLTKHRPLKSTDDLSKGLGTWVFQRTSWYEEIAKSKSGTLDLGLGLVALQTGQTPGVSFDLKPFVPTIIGDIQFHFVDTGSCTELLPCVTGIDCEQGLAAYANVPPGPHTATFHPPTGMTCTPKAFACKDGTPECVEFDVVAGVVVYASMPCN